jgi:hypothetical protein
VRTFLDWILGEIKRENISVVARDRGPGEFHSAAPFPWRLEVLSDEFMLDRSKAGPSHGLVFSHSLSDPRRVFFLFESNNLGSSGHDTYMGYAPPNLQLQRPLIERLRSVLGERQPSDVSSGGIGVFHMPVTERSIGRLPSSGIPPWTS